MERRAVPPRSAFREYLETIVVCVLALVFARGFVFMQSKVPSESMLDTLLVGDYILVDRFLYGAPGDQASGWLGQRAIRRGDVLVFKWPQDPDIDYVKRVIGLPGDRVEMVAGRVRVNGSELQEPYVRPENIDPRVQYGPLTVPPGEFFMMGDNRDNSLDSRYWGCLPRSLVKGRAFLVWYSYMEEPNDIQNTGVKRIGSILSKLVHFPVRTRWSRIMSMIR